jgi:hypothetical protein
MEADGLLRYMQKSPHVQWTAGFFASRCVAQSLRRRSRMSGAFYCR